MGIRDYSIEKISSIICDYRKNELDFDLDEEHVYRWIKQFDKEDRDIVLSETANLLERCYFNRADIEDFVDKLVSHTKLWGDDICDQLAKTCFLDIQKKGDSQTRLLSIVAQFIRKKYHVSISNEINEKTERYIYFDDCLFSGNTFVHDISPWINEAEDNSRLDVCYIAAHSAGLNYIEKTLKKLCKPKNIKFKLWRALEFNNWSTDRINYDCLWPKPFDDDLYIAQYLEKLQEAKENGNIVRFFREQEFNSELYTSNENREKLEHALLKAGAYICSIPARPNKSMRPLGYEFFQSFGFGAFFATFMNIANNCPLAYWWGDQNAPTYHPFSKWYPLMPRRGNENGGDIVVW